MPTDGGQGPALMLAVLSSLCFGVALVTARFGLRSLDTRSGASISIPAATLLLVVASPFTLDVSEISVPAVLVFATVGLFFPALVTIITFRSNALLGPTVTGAVSGIAPLFALAAAHLFLGERIPKEAVIASLAVLAGVAALSRSRSTVRPALIGWGVLLPLLGALVRALAQVGAKAGLLLWPNPFAASLIGYSMSSAAVIGARSLSPSKSVKLTGRNIAWFVTTGVLNGAAVLMMYAALSAAPVSVVAPIVASYPLVTAVVSALLLKEERLTLRLAAATAVTVAGVVYLMLSVSGN